MDLPLPDSTLTTRLVALGICLFGIVALVLSVRSRHRGKKLWRQLEQQKRRSDQLAHFVIPIGLSLAEETDFNRLLERILLEAKSLCNAEGGTLYLLTPGRQLQFSILINDVLKLAMGGTSPQPVTLSPLDLYDPLTRQPNLNSIATSCALKAQVIAVDDVYAEQNYDFTGTREFDRNMNYRTISVLCVPLQGKPDEVIGVLQLINPHDPETRQIVPFDRHLQQTIGMLGLLAAGALQSYFRLEKLKQEVAELRIQIDDTKKERQVAEIADSAYFKDLQSRARDMRLKLKNSGKS